MVKKHVKNDPKNDPQNDPQNDPRNGLAGPLVYYLAHGFYNVKLFLVVNLNSITIMFRFNGSIVVIFLRILATPPRPPAGGPRGSIFLIFDYCLYLLVLILIVVIVLIICS